MGRENVNATHDPFSILLPVHSADRAGRIPHDPERYSRFCWLRNTYACPDGLSF